MCLRLRLACCIVWYALSGALARLVRTGHLGPSTSQSANALYSGSRLYIVLQGTAYGLKIFLSAVPGACIFLSSLSFILSFFSSAMSSPIATPQRSYRSFYAGGLALFLIALLYFNFGRSSTRAAGGRSAEIFNSTLGVCDLFDSGEQSVLNKLTQLVCSLAQYMPYLFLAELIIAILSLLLQQTQISILILLTGFVEKMSLIMRSPVTLIVRTSVLATLAHGAHT